MLQSMGSQELDTTEQLNNHSGILLATRCGSAGKESVCNVGDLDLIPRLGRSPWRRERLPTPLF